MDILKRHLESQLSQTITTVDEYKSDLFEIQTAIFRLNGAIDKFAPESTADGINNILSEIVIDLYSSMNSALSSYYRTANICMRSTLELTLYYVYFYNSSYSFELWKKNEIDISWSDLNDPKRGVFNYLQKVKQGKFDERETEKIKGEFKELYRELSEFVHGKYEFLQSKQIGQIKYDECEFRTWINRMKRVICLIENVIGGL